MPPRPNSPRISYLPALVSVTILFSRTNARRLTSTFSPIPAEVNPPSELVFRSRHGRGSGSVSLVLRDQLLLSHVAGHLPSGPFRLSEYRCQLNRSMQHFVEVYWREFEILRFFLVAGLGAAPLGPDPLGYNPTGRFS